jgi:hypothetical protein
VVDLFPLLALHFNEIAFVVCDLRCEFDFINDWLLTMSKMVWHEGLQEALSVKGSVALSFRPSSSIFHLPLPFSPNFVSGCRNPVPQVSSHSFLLFNVVTMIYPTTALSIGFSSSSLTSEIPPSGRYRWVLESWMV